MLWITCNESISEELMEILDNVGVKGYTVWKDVLGKDNQGEKTHWGNAVFPGKEWVFMIFCEDENTCSLKEELEKFSRKDYISKAGIRVFINNAEELI